jgi:alkaline phosphatase D
MLGICVLRVVACSNYQSGFFNAYRDIVNKNDVDAVIHLGDYYYEYGHDDFDPGIDSSRLHEPATEILTLADYRLRHSQYKLDPDLRTIHQQYPFICVWDDHETANDSWTGGAENHTNGTEGNWEDRKSFGRQSYFEWIPIRDVHNSVGYYSPGNTHGWP